MWRTEQSSQDVLQECRLFETERNATWPQHTSLQEKLYGSREELKRTTHFISNLVLQVGKAANAKKKKKKQSTPDGSVSDPIHRVTMTMRR